MIIIAILLLLVALTAIWLVRAVNFIRERRRRRCIRRIVAYISSPQEFDVERLLHIGRGSSLQTIAEAVAYVVEQLHPATEQRLMTVVKFYGVDFYLIEQLKLDNRANAVALLSKIPLSRDAKLIMDSMSNL